MASRFGGRAYTRGNLRRAIQVFMWYVIAAYDSNRLLSSFLANQLAPALSTSDSFHVNLSKRNKLRIWNKEQ